LTQLASSSTRRNTSGKNSGNGNLSATHSTVRKTVVTKLLTQRIGTLPASSQNGLVGPAYGHIDRATSSARISISITNEPLDHAAVAFTT